MDVYSNPKSPGLPSGCEMTFSLLGMATCVSLLPRRLLGNAMIVYSLDCHSEPSLLQELPLAAQIFYSGGFSYTICILALPFTWRLANKAGSTGRASSPRLPTPSWQDQRRIVGKVELIGISGGVWLTHPTLAPSWLRKKKKCSLVLSKSHSK